MAGGEAFRTWATLNLRGDAYKKMEQFAKLTERTSKKVAALEKAMIPLGKSLRGIYKDLDLLNPKLGKLSGALINVRKNSSTSKEGIKNFSQATRSANTQVSNLTKNTRNLATNLSEVALKGELATKSLAGMRSGRVAIASAGSGRKRGMRLHGLSHGAALGLSAMVPEMGLIGGLGYGGGPGLAAAGTVGILAHQGFKQYTEYERRENILRAQGLSENQIGEADKLSRKFTPGMSPLTKMESYLAAQMATRDWDTAKLIAPRLAKASIAANTFGGMTEERTQDLIRFAEIWGGSDKDKILKGLDLGVMMMSTSGGTINPEQLRTFMRQGAGAFGRLSDLGYLGMEPILQEMGGQRGATGLVTLQQQLMGGSGTINNKRRVKDLQKLGIYKATYDSEGRPLTTQATQEAKELLATDPFLFLKYVLEKYKKDGTTKAGDIQSRFTLDFGRTPGQELYLMYKNYDKIELARRQAMKARGIDPLYDQYMQSNQGVVTRLSEAWHRMTLEFGMLSNPIVIGGMNALSAFLEKLGSFFYWWSHTDFQHMVTKMGVNQPKMSPIWSMGQQLNAPISGDDGFYTGMIKGGSFYQGLSDTILNAVKAQPPMQVNLMMDSKKVGEATISYMSNKMNQSGTLSGMSVFNPGIGIPATAYTSTGQFQ